MVVVIKQGNEVVETIFNVEYVKNIPVDNYIEIKCEYEQPLLYENWLYTIVVF